MSIHWEISGPGSRSNIDGLDISLIGFWICIEYVQVLNIHTPLYNRFLNMRRDAIMEGFWILHDSEYSRFLCVQALHKVLNVPEHGWIMPYGKGLKLWICLVNVSKNLNKSSVLNMLGFRIWRGCEYASIKLGAEYAWISLNMSQ